VYSLLFIFLTRTVAYFVFVEAAQRVQEGKVSNATFFSLTSWEILLRATSGRGTMTSNSEATAMTSRAGESRDVTTRSRDHHHHHDDVAAKRRRQIKLIIIGMTLLLIVVCVILVAVTLSMSQHIDDMGKQHQGPPQRPNSITLSNSPCNSPCVASPVGNSPQGGPGLSGLVHEEAHPSISYHT